MIKFIFFGLNGRNFKYFEQFRTDFPIFFYGTFKRYIVDFVFTNTDHYIALIFQQRLDGCYAHPACL